MVTHIFSRKQDNWYVSNPINSDMDWQMNEGAAGLLNLLSGSDRYVKITFHNEYFENADALWLQQPTQPFLDGGYYYMNKLNGTEVHYNIWLCDILKLVYGTTPSQIFFKKEWSWS